MQLEILGFLILIVISLKQNKVSALKLLPSSD
jgi:hypothetical protein